MTITKADPDSEFWQIVARGAREAEGYPDWKRGATLKPAPAVRTTITVPVRRYTRVTVRAFRHAWLSVEQGNQACGTCDQAPIVQAHVNEFEYCHMELQSLLSAMRECQKWHEQARKQRGLWS